MNSLELRLGNFIRFSDDGTIFEVGSIELNGFTVKNENETTWIESVEFQPIPLTEEWLLKFGFEKTEGMHINSYKLVINIISPDEKIYLILSSHNYYWIGQSYKTDSVDVGLGKLDYVHQLQNLYFALTGKELTIKQ